MMRTSSSFRRLFFQISVLALAAGLGLSGPAVAAGLSGAALGSSGDLYEVVSGTYGKLFPQSASGAVANEHVLALEITAPDRSQRRLLVPGTDNPTVEAPATLLYDRDAETLIVLWQTEEVSSGTLLHLSSYHDGELSDVVTIEDPTLAQLTQTRVVLTHDRYLVELDAEEPELISRTILHMAWVAREGGTVDIRYSPLIFLDGSYTGWHQVFSLRDLMVGEPLDPSARLSADLENTLHLEATRDGQRVLAAFANSLSGELNVLDIGVLPLEMAFLSDAVRDRLLELEDQYSNRDDLVSFADIARLEIIGTGVRRKLHPQLVDYVATEVAHELVAVAPTYGDYAELVEHLRQFAVTLTAPLVMSDIGFVPGIGASEIIEIDVSGLFGGDVPSQILDLHVLASVPLPATGNGATTIYTSRNGQNLLVVWEDMGRGRYDYVEWTGQSWTDRRRLRLDDPELAHQVLRLRVR